MSSRFVLVPLMLLLGACSAARETGSARDTQPEAVSLLGTRLHPREMPPETRQRLERNLAEARALHEANPDDPEAITWLGRRLAYLERYRDAIEVFGEGIRKHPNDAGLYRHRGHRYITVRDFDRAIADLEKAASLVAGQPDVVEQDGAPNQYNIPVSTLQSNIWYHLGLAYYLKGDWDNALRAYREGMKVSVNDDMKVATSDWLYMTLRRMGRDAEARQVLEPIHKDMRILENQTYLRRLLMYKGEIQPDALLDADDALEVATQGYGVGNWYLYGGQPERAQQVFERVVAGNYWSAFGYIAAEAELARARRS